MTGRFLRFQSRGTDRQFFASVPTFAHPGDDTSIMGKTRLEMTPLGGFFEPRLTCYFSDRAILSAPTRRGNDGPGLVARTGTDGAHDQSDSYQKIERLAARLGGVRGAAASRFARECRPGRTRASAVITTAFSLVTASLDAPFGTNALANSARRTVRFASRLLALNQ